MKKFEEFLKRVQEENPDEFQELHSILSRHDTLKHSNDRLKENLKTSDGEVADLTEKIQVYKK